MCDKLLSKRISVGKDIMRLAIESVWPRWYNMDKKQKHLMVIAPHRITELRIRTDYAVRTDSNGLRNICFCVSDFTCRHITEEISMGEGFYPQETDGVDCRNWAGEPSSGKEILLLPCLVVL